MRRVLEIIAVRLQDDDPQIRQEGFEGDRNQNQKGSVDDPRVESYNGMDNLDVNVRTIHVQKRTVGAVEKEPLMDLINEDVMKMEYQISLEYKDSTLRDSRSGR